MSGSCPVCEREKSKFVFNVKGWEIRECLSCGAGFLGDGPELAPDYEGDYLNQKQGEGDLRGYFDYEAELELHIANYKDNLKILASEGASGRLLDVGCASGHFLVAAGNAGFDATGVDVSEAAIEQARGRGLTAYAGDVMTLPLKGPFDVITLWETIEHVPDPVPFLAHLRSLLAPGGLLVIGTGDDWSPVARLFGKRWWYLTPPDHCIYYNQVALATALRRGGYGLPHFHRIWRHRTSARNVAMKLMRAFDVAPGRALKLAAAVPNAPLSILHGTTLVAVGRPNPS